MIDAILGRLEKVKPTSSGNWLACCPAHEDRHPSLTLREEADGRILVRCFAGCGFEEIVSAVGLGLDPWFPAKDSAIEMRRNESGSVPAVRRPYPAGDVLEALVLEMGVIYILACDMHAKRAILEEDYKRLGIACERFNEARRLALG